jgi:hypothetical protein
MLGTSKSVWGFDPRSVPGCQLWLDGSDVSVLFSDVAGTSAITTNGQTIRCWKDKSGRGCNATQAGNAPIWNSSNCVNFTQTLGQSMNLPNGTLPFASGTNAYSIFAVANLSNTSGGLKTIIGNGSAGTNSFNALQIQAQSIANLWYNNDVAGGSLTANTFFIANIAFDGSTRYIYQTGTSVNTTASSGWAAPNTNNVIGVEPATGNWYYDGNIGEIIVFNTALTTSQRQQVEGYLAHKWGLSLSIPSTHPFYSIRPHLRGFQPNDIDGCQLWLDAADQSSLVLSGSNVTQWTDKSGNGRNVSASSSYPTFTTNGILFNGATPNVLSNAASFSSTTALNSFVVFRSTVASTRQRVFVYSYSGQNRYVATDTTFNSISTNASQGYGPVSYSPNTTYIYSANTYTGSSISHSENGVESSYQLESATISSTKLIVGGESSVYFTGTIYEIILYDAFFTTSQRQQVEGYLAHKWGLTLSYPANTPLSIPGCSLWLDAADTSQVTFSSSTNVNTWLDKSGFNNNCSNQSLSTTITYPGTKVNGLNTVNFTAGCIRGAFNGSSVINTTDVTIFIVTVETAPNDNLRMFSLTTAASYQDDTANTMLVYCAPGNYQLTFYRGGAMPTAYTVTQNVPFIYSLTQTSGTGSMWLNGGSNITTSITTSAFAVTNYNIGTQYLANQNYTGLMCEVLVYKSLLSTTQRQTIEGYLANKWGITISATLPSTHPFKSITPASLPFSPTTIPGCKIWFDSADQSSLTLSGTTVTAWKNKTGNSNASTGSGTVSINQASLNGRSSLRFPAGTNYLNVGAQTYTTSYRNQFFVVTVGPAGSNYWYLNCNDSICGQCYSWQDLPGDIELNRVGANGIYVSNPTNFFSSTSVVSICTSSGGNTGIWVNGVSQTLAANNVGTGSFWSTGTTSTTITLGGENGRTTGRLDVYELLQYDGDLTTSQRQKIEGYLAHKWGLTVSLSEGHPFKKFPPA